MKLLGTAVVLGLLVAVWGQVLRPPCDSPEVEEAALVAQDYLNAHHTHGYKHTLNRIEDVKLYTMPNGDYTYVLELDSLETDCHVLDPTPLVNCTVRPKKLTAVEGDCDVVLQKVGGALTVTAFKCKTEESTEDLCINCPTLLPLNNTAGLDFVQVSLGTLNNMTEDHTFALVEVGRMSSQASLGGIVLTAEYVVNEVNCTVDPCVPLDDKKTATGICTAKGSNTQHSVDCKMFPILVPVTDTNSTAAADPLPPPVVHVHTANMTHKPGLKFHKLTAFHNPQLSGFLSAESAESAEIVPVAPAVPAAADPVPAVADPAPAAADPAPAAADPAPTVDSGSASDSSHSAELLLSLVKREVPAAPVPIMADVTVAQAAPIPLVQLCPGRVRYF